MNKRLLFYDTYERHRKVASLIFSGETVLDVGGAINHLSAFSKAQKVVTANLQGREKSDITIARGKLPFKTNSFDVVCSIDVLEHMPKNNRVNFINELQRVAKKRIILSFPLGNRLHNQYENQLQKWLKSKGKDVTYLKEHIKFGLPQKEEISKITKGQKADIIYSGNIKINKFLFHLFMFDPSIKFIRKVVFNLKLIFNFITNPIFYKLLANQKFSDTINRAYLIIEK